MIKKLMLATLLIAVCLFSYLFVASPYRIAGPSGGNCMEPAIKDGELCFVNHLYYKFNPYKASDIIVFQHEDKIWISRIIALENQEIKISDKTILVDDKVYSDGVERNWQDWKYGQYGVDAVAKVPAGHVYVLSDNLSAHHDDSRVFGPISHKAILGKVW